MSIISHVSLLNPGLVQNIPFNVKVVANNGIRIGVQLIIRSLYAEIERNSQLTPLWGISGLYVSVVELCRQIG